MPHHQSSASSSSSSSFVSKPVKMKRTRQRVDAGEPRNSYASIANFSSRGGYHGYSSKYSSATTNTNTSNHHHHNQHRQMPGIESMNANNGNIQTCTNSNSGSNAHHHHHQPHTNPYAAIAINHHPSPIPDLSQNPYLTPPKNILRDSPFYHRSSCGGGAGDVMMDHHQASFFQQLCHQNPMTTAFINQQSAQQQSSVNKSGLFSANNNNKYHIEQQSSINTDQLNCTGSNYHQAAAFLHQLQSINAHNNGNDSNNMAMAATNLLNNLQSANEIAAATNSLFAANNVFDAQLLRDILESGAAVAAAAAAAAAVANNEMKSSEDKSSKQTSNARNCELTSNKSCSPFRNGSCTLGGEQSNKQQNRFNNVEPSEADNRSSSLLFDYIGDSCFGEASCKQPVDPAGPKDHVLNIEQDERGENSTNDIIAGLHEEDPVNRSKQTDCTENDDDDPKMKATSLNEGSGINESQTNNDDDCRGEVVVVVTAAEMERDGNLAKEEQYANNARPPLHSLNTSNQPNCAVNKQSSSLGSTFSTTSSSSSSEESISLDRSCCASLLNSNHHSNKPSLLCSNQRDLDVDKRHTSLKIHSSVDCSQENMLLERLPNNNSTNRLSTSIMKSDLDDEDDTSASNGHLDHVNSENTTKTTSSCINGASSTATIIINGCKKRKLYQPQQSTKMVNSSNGSIDTEDDLDDEDDDVDEDGDELVNSNNNNNNDDDDDNEPNNNERRLHSIEVEDMSNVGVVGEDDEGYDESGVVLQDQQQQQRSQLSQHQSSMIEETKSNIELNHKELDLSLTSSTSSHNIDAQQRSNINNDSTINNNKRARMSDYERDLSKFQQQLFQKYTAFQLFQQQQQQSKSNGRSPSTTANTATSYNQRSSPLSNVIMNNTNANTQSNHSDCDMINIAPDAATLFAAAAVAASESFGQMSPSAAAHLPQQQPQQQQPASSDKICKIYDMDLFVEAVTSQVIQSMSRIVANSIRSQIEAQQQHQRPQQTQPTITNQRSSVKETNTSSKAGATDLLAQMLDAKYSRQMKTTASSPVNNNKNGRDASGSPFSVSPVSKASSFVYPPNAAASGFGYGKQASGMYGRDTPVMVNTNSTSSNSYPVAATAVSPVMAAEQTEAISLVVGPAKKRRNKVTDSRLPVRTPTRINRNHNNDDHIRETLSVSPPLTNGSVHFPTAAATANSLPGSLASLQHANEFFDPTTITTATGATTPFSFGEQPAASRLANSLFNAEDVDQLKNSLTATNTTNGSSVNGAVASSGTDAVANAVAAAATAHHLRMFVASRASPDSMSGGYPGAVLSSYGRGSGTGSENGGDGSETNDTQSLYDPSMPMTSTLSPMHLRKAKLMFFYVRYPSSSILKMFFPDIKFNKNNTAQLVKWFSNFREFYYIQMEKYARQALSEGTKGAEDLHVTDDCELLRVLNLHYNRSNHIAIPENFRSVSETTLREFFKSLQQNKDTEQSWKKAIYKIIARLDDNVPEYFKNPNFMEQLE